MKIVLFIGCVGIWIALIAFVAWQLLKRHARRG